MKVEIFTIFDRIILQVLRFAVLLLLDWVRFAADYCDRGNHDSLASFLLSAVSSRKEHI
jgi:hypothetical protein